MCFKIEAQLIYTLCVFEVYSKVIQLQTYIFSEHLPLYVITRYWIWFPVTHYFLLIISSYFHNTTIFVVNITDSD